MSHHNATLTTTPETRKGVEELRPAPVEQLVLLPADAGGGMVSDGQGGSKKSDPMTYAINGNLLQFIDPNDNSLLTSATKDIQARLDAEGYNRNDSMSVVGTGNDMPSVVLREDMLRLQVNRTALESGVSNRMVAFGRNGEQEIVTSNPFDSGEYLDVSNFEEDMGLPGPPVHYPQQLLERASRPDFPEFLKSVGRFDTNNGVLTWVTSTGEQQVAPKTQEKVDRLIQLGYRQDSIGVPLSNGVMTEESRQKRVFSRVNGEDIGTQGEIWDTLNRKRRIAENAISAAIAA
jgi:hypothetical protein